MADVRNWAPLMGRRAASTGRFETGRFLACDLPFRFHACRAARQGSERHRMVVSGQTALRLSYGEAVVFTMKM
jgi:hypothetical protein